MGRRRKVESEGELAYKDGPPSTVLVEPPEIPPEDKEEDMDKEEEDKEMDKEVEDKEVEDKEVEDEDSPSASPKHGKLKLTDVVEEALDEIGDDAKASDIKDWIARKYAGWQFNESSLSTATSNAKKKRRGSPSPTPRRSGPISVNVSSPTVEELMRLLPAIRDVGTIAEVEAMVERVEDLAETVGGLGRLRKCLEALRSIGDVLALR